ncbi:hypothetical protein SNEBB_006142 [Seison nebaliae]|nr:hypothetical protein SNEBB_006142 [Seison nebaliae]
MSLLMKRFNPMIALIRSKHTLPELKYDYSAMEPVIGADIMQVHHGKHHQTYVNNLNMFEEKMEEAMSKNRLEDVLKLQSAHKFNGGGHINHSILWNCILPPKHYKSPSNELMKMIEKSFGSFENLRNKLVGTTTAVQGSGWGWLGYNKEKNDLQIATTSNQDLLSVTHNLEPLYTIDVWEHAYYLQYKNVRPDYVAAIFDKMTNWEYVEKQLNSLKKQ